MDKPSKDGGSADSWYSGVGNLDVHYSSGPANHMFYLLSEGSGTKTINGVTYTSTTSDGVAVAGIGRAAALQIWYNALTTNMTSSTTYAGVVNAFAGINAGSHITVPSTGVTVTNPGNQTSTVGTAVSLQIGASSTNSGSLTYAASGLPAGLSISSSTGAITGTPTAAGSSSTTVTVTDGTGATGTASFTWTVNSSGGGSCTSTQLLGNAGFESGNTTWTASSGVIANGSGQAARTGSYKAWPDGYGSTHTDTLSQSVTVPSGCTGTTFTFSPHVDTAETTTSTRTTS